MEKQHVKLKLLISVPVLNNSTAYRTTYRWKYGGKKAELESETWVLIHTSFPCSTTPVILLFHCKAGNLEDFLGQLVILNKPRYIKPSRGVFRAWPNSAGGLGVVQMADTRGTRTLIKGIMSLKKKLKNIPFLST